MTYFAGITGIGVGLPQKVLTNQDMEKIVDTSDEWIVSRTGIRERRIADEGKAASDYSIEAAKSAIEMSGVSPEEIDMIIECTVTPDMMYPATAALVQHGVGAVNAAAFDLSAGCTGFIYGLSMAANLIKSGAYKHIVVVGCDILSRVTDYTDRSTCVLFGDGAGAVLVSRTESEGIIGDFLGADGSCADYLKLPAGNSRMPASHETVDNKLHFTQMEGSEVFKFAVRAMPEAVKKVLEKSGYSLNDVDYLIPHQANIRIIEAAIKRFEIDRNKVAISIDKYGNMSSASIPVTLYDEYKAGKIQKDDLMVLVGFGAGLTYGSVLCRWLIG